MPTHEGSTPRVFISGKPIPVFNPTMTLTIPFATSRIAMLSIVLKSAIAEMDSSFKKTPISSPLNQYLILERKAITEGKIA